MEGNINRNIQAIRNVSGSSSIKKRSYTFVNLSRNENIKNPNTGVRTPSVS